MTALLQWKQVFILLTARPLQRQERAKSHLQTETTLSRSSLFQIAINGLLNHIIGIASCGKLKRLFSPSFLFILNADLKINFIFCVVNYKSANKQLLQT